MVTNRFGHDERRVALILFRDQIHPINPLAVLDHKLPVAVCVHWPPGAIGEPNPADFLSVHLPVLSCNTPVGLWLLRHPGASLMHASAPEPASRECRVPSPLSGSALTWPNHGSAENTKLPRLAFLLSMGKAPSRWRWPDSRSGQITSELHVNRRPVTAVPHSWPDLKQACCD